MRSTEFIQEQDAAYENHQRNPEMDVRRDGAKQIAGNRALGRHFADLDSMTVNLDCNLRDG
jgi:hypothetical protein